MDDRSVRCAGTGYHGDGTATDQLMKRRMLANVDLIVPAGSRPTRTAGDSDGSVGEHRGIGFDVFQPSTEGVGHPTISAGRTIRPSLHRGPPG